MTDWRYNTRTRAVMKQQSQGVPWCKCKINGWKEQRKGHVSGLVMEGSWKGPGLNFGDKDVKVIRRGEGAAFQNEQKV